MPTNTAAACPVGAALSLPPIPIAVGLTASSPRMSASCITLTPKASSDALSPGGKIGRHWSRTFGPGPCAKHLYQKPSHGKKSIGRDPRTKTELAADEVDREARGNGPHMAASTQRAEVEGSGVMREA